MLNGSLETSYIFSVWGAAFGIFFLLILSAFFSGSEMALTASSRAKLRSMTDRGSKGARKALEITNDNESLIGTILLGNNLVNILSTSLATTIFVTTFGDKGIAYATVTMTMLILIFAELLPKTYAINNPETAARRVAPLVSFFIYFLSPVIGFVRKVVHVILSLTGLKIDPKKQVLALEEIAGAIALHHSEGTVKKDARDRLLGVLDLPDRAVEEVMLHRSQIEMVDADDSPKKILEQCLRSPYTRIPIFKKNPENVVGVLHAKDLLRKTSTFSSAASKKFDIEKFDIMKVAMKPYFVPENDINKNIWFHINKLDMQLFYEEDFSSQYYFVLLEPQIKKFINNPASNLNNNHLNYAITWFLLSLSSVVMLLIIRRKNE